MKIQLKTVCPEQVGELPDGEYEVADGCSAAQALGSCMEAAGLPPLPQAQVEKLIFMRNYRHAKPEEALTDGDRLTVLRPLTGG